MKALNSHLLALKLSFDTLSKGKLLVYFLPAVVAALVYLWLMQYSGSINAAADNVHDLWLIGGLLSGLFHGIAWLYDFIALQFFKFIVLVCLAPFNCILSEKFDNELTGNRFDGGFLRMMNDLLRALIVVTTAFIGELITLLLYSIVSIFIPDVIDTAVYFIISGFYFGFAFYDYSLERYGEGTMASWRYAFGNFTNVALTGIIFVLIFRIPVAGIVVAPLLATMLATAVYLQTRGMLKIPSSNLN